MHRGTSIDCDVMDSIVKHSGGIIVQQRQDVTVVGACSLEKTLTPSQAVVSVAWLADSIEAQKILPFDKYTASNGLEDTSCINRPSP